MIRPSTWRHGVARPLAFVCAASLALAVYGCGDQAPPETEPVVEIPEPAAMPAVATVRVTEPAEGAQLPAGPVRVVLEAENITIVAAGDTTPNTGHHHLLLNMAIPAEGEAIPAGQEGIVHLGQAQTEYTFEGLQPGQYTLIAVIGDFAHRVLPQATDTVNFTVAAP
jgi:hypothetical protein